jgi:hypothetical protein
MHVKRWNMLNRERLCHARGEARSAFERIVKEGHRAGEIIGGIRAMFRKESTKRAPVAVNEFVCDVIATSLSEITSHNISLALQLFDDLPPVHADRVQLQQVLASAAVMGVTIGFGLGSALGQQTPKGIVKRGPAYANAQSSHRDAA